MADLFETPHPRSGEIKRLKRIKGQVEGIERMIRDHRTCPEVVQQVKAVRSALLSLEAQLLEDHLRDSVKQVMEIRDPFATEKKISELLQLIK